MTRPINVAGMAFYEVKSISVNEWHPLSDGQGKPEQVHLAHGRGDTRPLPGVPPLYICTIAEIHRRIDMSTTSPEGWGVVTGKKAHYYRDTFSLCRKRGFYTGPLEADEQPSPDDCAECRRKLDVEKRKRENANAR